MLKKILKNFVLILVFLLSSCAKSETNITDKLNQKLLIWHSFIGNDAQIFNELLTSYQTLYPQIQIINEYVNNDQITNKFIEDSKLGLGPDLALVEFSSLIDLSKHKSILELQPNDINLTRYLPITLNQIYLKNKIYAIPFSIKVRVLCYNKNHIKQPAKSLSELVEQAKQGRVVGMTSSYINTLWGVGNFGGRFFNDKGHLYLSERAWSQWMNWLKIVNSESTIILSEDKELLRKAFIDHKIDYYTCESTEISALKVHLSEEELGVTFLPKGKQNVASPIIYTQTIVFNYVSSPKQQKLALDLSNFLTNTENQQLWAIQTESQIPANVNVKIDRRLSEIEYILYQQSKHGVAIPLDLIINMKPDDFAKQDYFYNRVLFGEMSPMNAAAQINKIHKLVQTNNNQE